MSTNVVQHLAVIKAETTPGDRIAVDRSADNDILMSDLSIDFDIPKESIGKLSDGSMRQGPTFSRASSLKIGYVSDIRWSGDIAVAPAWWTKVAVFCGYKIDSTVPATLKLVWDGTVGCDAASFDVGRYRCGNPATGNIYKVRGAVGNMAIGWEGSAAPWKITVSDFTGAYDPSDNETVSEVMPVATPDNTATEKSSDSNTVIGGVAYAVENFNFDPSNTIGRIPASVAGKNGVARYGIKDMDTSITMDVVALDASTDDPHVDIVEDTTIASIVVNSKHYVMTITKAEIIEAPFADIEGSDGYSLKINPEKVELIQKV